ncbi:hypothetical protein F4803DRAFT_555660 [Xylaria telfairii]|nr:hypothetical protein F4803DRAFT_555660 [Xylaria telfairii]
MDMPVIRCCVESITEAIEFFDEELAHLDWLRYRPDAVPTLYRVQYPHTRTGYGEEGLFAADTETLHAFHDFGEAVRKHFTWSDRGRSTFISFFSNRDSAIEWGRKESWLGRGRNPRGDWSLLTINTAMIEDPYIFKLDTLVDELELEIPTGAQMHIPNGYICLHTIPAHAIESVESGKDVKPSYEMHHEEDTTPQEVLEMLNRLGLS